jgi:very-short-patch-repair endonuclease
MDGKVVTPDRAIAEIAARQRGVVSLAQIRRLGLTDDAVRARTLAGRLHRVHRGVYAVGHSGLPWEGWCVAAVLAVGGGPVADEREVLARWGAAISHRSAAIVWGLLSPQEDLWDVVIRRDGGRRGRAGIRVHSSRTLRVTDVTLRHGIPVTTPARTIADLRRASAAGRPGALSPRDLRRTIRQAEVAGLPLGEAHGSDRTRSDLERDFLELCRRHRLPPPEVNVRVGRHLVDFLWPAPRLIVETDSYLYHRGQIAFQDDRARDLDLRRRGYEVIRLSERQVNEQPGLVAETLVAALEG